MGGNQLIFGRLVREATGFDMEKTERIARALDSQHVNRKLIESRFPKTIRILEELALKEIKVSRFEDTLEMSDSLRMRAKAELAPLFAKLGRSLEEEAGHSHFKDRAYGIATSASKLGSLVCVGIPAGSFLAFSFFSIEPTRNEWMGLGLLALVGAPMVYALGKLEKRNEGLANARKEFEGTIRILARDVRHFLEHGVPEHAEE